jgi:rubrerythrin
MSAFQELIDRLFTSESTLHECRNCGESVDAAVDSCPNCGATEIASYQVD